MDRLLGQIPGIDDQMPGPVGPRFRIQPLKAELVSRPILIIPCVILLFDRDGVVKGVQVPTDFPVQTEDEHPFRLFMGTGQVAEGAAVDREFLPRQLLCLQKQAVNFLPLILQDPVVELAVERQ